MQNALNDAKLNAGQIGYINAHGTSTPAGDIAETNAVKSIFGADAYNVLMGSTKSMTGHLLGAAGAVEAIFSVQSLIGSVVPPTINLDTPDEGCDLDYIRGTARDINLDYVLCNSFGFGGTNGSLIFKKM
jgi:3-oxoacyl-[acyl-carrier-protein] synthase II